MKTKSSTLKHEYSMWDHIIPTGNMLKNIMKKDSYLIIVISIIIIFLVAFLLTSCKKNKKDPSYWTYNGSGDGTIESNQKAVITVAIQSNLNVNGNARLGTNASVKNDLNLNDNGKVVFLADKNTDTIYVDGNINCNDTLLIQRGILKVSHDFNINSSGVVNCSNDALVIVAGNLNQSGILWGNYNIKAAIKHINKPETTNNNPIPFYSYSNHY